MGCKQIVIYAAIFFTTCLRGEEALGFRITSQAFKESAAIPSKYTCEGVDVSPPLTWESVPVGTKSFALIMDDPDAPGWTRVHWVVYNIPGTIFSSEEGDPPIGSTQGVNDKGAPKYRGPCPPEGRHRYFFKLYALKEVLDLPKEATKEQVEKAMEPFILGKAQLIGTYSKEDSK